MAVLPLHTYHWLFDLPAGQDLQRMFSHSELHGHFALTE